MSRINALSRYRGLEEEHWDSIVLLLVGDFYEAFGDNAITVAAILNLTLTKRNKSARGKGESEWMVGFPKHMLVDCLKAIKSAGHLVTVVEE